MQLRAQPDESVRRTRRIDALPYRELRSLDSELRALLPRTGRHSPAEGSPRGPEFLARVPGVVAEGSAPRRWARASSARGPRPDRRRWAQPTRAQVAFRTPRTNPLVPGRARTMGRSSFLIIQWSRRAGQTAPYGVPLPPVMGTKRTGS